VRLGVSKSGLKNSLPDVFHRLRLLREKLRVEPVLFKCFSDTFEPKRAKPAPDSTSAGLSKPPIRGRDAPCREIQARDLIHLEHPETIKGGRFPLL
jgi:hypothetical protein